LSMRVSSGNAELDRLIGGGFGRSDMILLVGRPGTGKTIFSTKFIYEGALKYGEPGVYACFAETKAKFIDYQKSFGIELESLVSEGRIAVLDLSIATEVDIQSSLNRIMESIVLLRAKRLVIDSLTAMTAGIKSPLEKRHLIHLLYRMIQKSGCTSIVITDMPYGSKKLGEGLEEFISDGIIFMQNRFLKDGSVERRVRILKMRGVNHSLKAYTYTICDKGIVINIEEPARRS